MSFQNVTGPTQDVPQKQRVPWWVYAVAASLLVVVVTVAVVALLIGGDDPHSTKSSSTSALSSYIERTNQLQAAYARMARDDETTMPADCASALPIVHQLQAAPYPTDNPAAADSMRTALSYAERGLTACTESDWATATTYINASTANLKAATAALR
jgi:hypothetical protein